MKRDTDSKVIDSGDMLLSLREAARRLGVKPATVRTWVWRGRVKPVKVGNRNMFRLSDVEHWVREGV